MEQNPVPAELRTVLGDFCQAKRTGSVVLDIKDGHVLQIKATTTTPIAKVDKK